jgi:hypothetical protein
VRIKRAKRRKGEKEKRGKMRTSRKTPLDILGEPSWLKVTAAQED